MGWVGVWKPAHALFSRVAECWCSLASMVPISLSTIDLMV
jgi:hypothetical protein